MTKVSEMEIHYPGITIYEAMQAVHLLAVEKGWWDKHRELPELLCLVHAEVSECLEAYRENNAAGVAEELADIIIRVFDIAAAANIDLEKAIKEKHDYNKTRPYRHGGKLV